MARWVSSLLWRNTPSSNADAFMNLRSSQWHVLTGGVWDEHGDIGVEEVAHGCRHANWGVGFGG
eukprot:1165587-Amphidinium_carterae.1